MAGDRIFASCVIWTLALSLVTWGLIGALWWLISKLI
jgi:hypothetical protein